MKFEIVEDAGAWIVLCEGQEVARFLEQDHALADIASRLKEQPGVDACFSLSMRYQVRN